MSQRGIGKADVAREKRGRRDKSQFKTGVATEIPGSGRVGRCYAREHGAFSW